MLNPTYVRAEDAQDASRLLSTGGARARLLAGGTDLIPLAKDEIEPCESIVDISGWTAGSGIRVSGNDLVIGALTPLSDIASDNLVQVRYTALAEACRLAATPQLRNMGTIGGNLLQQTRCWYYRGPFNCWMKGGENCYARGGENEYHSILATDVSHCVSAHPSDPGPALLALDARLRYVFGEQEDEMPVESLFALPDEQHRTYTRLPEGAVITAIVLNQDALRIRSTYEKAMARASWAFALAGVAVAVPAGEEITGARVAVSGVAPIPLRLHKVEAALEGQAAKTLDYDALADLAVADARPLAHNGYKVDLLRAIVREAVERVCKPS